MKTVNELLSYNFSPTLFVLAGKKIITQKTIDDQTSHIEQLNKVVESVGRSSFQFRGNNLIPQVFKKFKFLIKKNNLQSDSFERRDLRTLTYSLFYSDSKEPSIFSNQSELELLFKVLDFNWRDSYLTGLIDCYLKYWEYSNLPSHTILGEFLLKKLKSYEGGRLVLKSFKLNIKYFDKKSGDVILGSDLSLKKISILNATKYLALPESFKTYSYFSKVICSYYEKRKENIGIMFEELSMAMREHNNLHTSKRIISKLIIQATENPFIILQDKIKTLAFDLIGDPGNGGNWIAFNNASESEKQELQRSRIILNEWITRQFINVFFEKCINNPRRKSFWLKYTKEITQFRVVGSSVIKQMLMNDERISRYVLPRFSITRSFYDKNSALMFIMRKHLFIEFSDDGAFYVYKLSNSNAPSIESLEFQSTDNLKITSMKQLIYRTGFDVGEMNSEGKLPHRDGEATWEEIADYWIKEETGIHV